MAKIDATSRKDNVDAEAVMARNGVQPVPVNAENVADWSRTIEALFPEIRQRSDIDVALFDELLALLREYRSRSGGR